jgi:hypothetical protein
MDQHKISSICKDIYRKFPEVSGTKPEIRPQGETRNLLIFHGKGETADGKKITRTVRVVVEQSGKVVKVTTSR